ncbi:hypothetical protein Tco_0641741 [Tanacetum coccineum]
MLVATTPENTPMDYRASTSANPNLVISLAFVEANYEALESLLRDRRRQMRNNDLRTEVEYFSEDYDEEREMEPILEPTRAATPPLRVASPRVCKRKERIVGFEGAQSRGESRVERNTEEGRPIEESPQGNGGQSVNLPPILAAHLGRSENGQPLQSSLTSAYGGQALPNNIGGNLPSNRLLTKPQPRRVATTIIIIIILSSSSSPPPPRDHPLHLITATHTTITAPRHPPPRPPPKDMGCVWFVLSTMGAFGFMFTPKGCVGFGHNHLKGALGWVAATQKGCSLGGSAARAAFGFVEND